ncbi:hypothetical protein JW906_00950 [bacterium]|nr:hypothetical protein [bacterium]
MDTRTDLQKPALIRGHDRMVPGQQNINSDEAGEEKGGKKILFLSLGTFHRAMTNLFFPGSMNGEKFLFRNRGPFTP